MKKIFILTSFLMAAIFGLATMSWAQEAGVFDDVQKIIIRAYTTPSPPTSGTYSAYLEVRDSNGDRISSDKLNVTYESLTVPQTVPAEADGYTYKIHDNTLSSPNLSLSFDNVDGITYMICTNESVHVMKFRILTFSPINAACGSASGNAFYSAPNTNLCNVTNTPAVVTGAGPWSWTCTGINGGDNAGCIAYKKVDGQCGSSNGGTFTSAPATNLCNVTNTPAVVTGAGPWNWTCNGSNGGSTASCSANIQSSSLSDLIVSSLSAPTSLDNNSPFGISLTVRNQGTGSAGPFTVTVYVNQTYTPGGTVLLTWNVGSLAAGQSISQTFSNVVVNNLPTHVSFYFVAKADSGNIITETDETNNAKYRGFTVAR